MTTVCPRVIRLTLFIATVFLATVAMADDSQWSRGFAPPGVFRGDLPGSVSAIGYRAGSVYIAGYFDRVGLVPANNIARYTDGQWHALGDGFSGRVVDMVVLDQAVYAAGLFTPDGGEQILCVARWHDGQWSVTGDAAFDSSIECLHWFNSNLYASGDFRAIGGEGIGRVARWTGVDWEPVAVNTLLWQGWDTGTVYALQDLGGELWAGGDFDYANPWTMPYLAYLDDVWRAPGTGIGFNDIVRCFAVSGSGSLWVGGDFSTVEHLDSPYLAIAYGDHTLHPFEGTPPDRPVIDLMHRDFSLVVATDQWLRSYDQFGWHSLWDSIRAVHTMVDIGTDLWVGGGLAGPGGFSDGVARWDGDGWRRIGAGLASSDEARDYITTFTTFDGRLVAGGYFTVFSVSEDVPHSYNVGMYDGQAWRPLGHGFTSEVNALAVYDGDLVAGGQFSTSGPDFVSYLGRWDGDAWQELGGGANGNVTSLVEYDGMLAVAGEFSRLGSLTCDGVGGWNGVAWVSLAGEGGNVASLAVHDGDLYAAGLFTSMGGVAANHVARWDGAQWHAVGDGLDGLVIALCSHGGELWAGRRIFSPEVVALSRWDGASWHDAGTMVASEAYTDVQSLLSTSDGLVVGGAFDTVDGVAANHVAIWNGIGWDTLGSGVSGGFWYTSVRALHVQDERLYLGGDFTHAGSTLSASIARWEGVMTPVFLQSFTARGIEARTGPAVAVNWRVTSSSDPADFRLTGVRDDATWSVAARRTAAGSWSALDRAATLAGGGSVSYRLEAREGDAAWQEIGRETVTLASNSAWTRPRLAVVPNPANPRATIELWLPRSGPTDVAVFDLRGRRVASLLRGVQAGGAVSLVWAGTDDTGRELASGVYLVRASDEIGVTTARVALVR